MPTRSLPKLQCMLAVLSCVSGITALTTSSSQAGTLANLGVQQATPYDGFVQGLERKKEIVSLPIQGTARNDSSVIVGATHFVEPINGSDTGVKAAPTIPPTEAATPTPPSIASTPSGDPMQEQGEKTVEPLVHRRIYLGNSEPIIKSEVPPAPKRVEVPEPSAVLGLATIVGICAIKRQRYLRS